MLGNEKSPVTVNYMLRHFLTVNVPDPLPDADRRNAPYSQYFSGDGTGSQINYLERKLYANGSCIVYFNTGTGQNQVWAKKTEGVDYTLDRSALTIAWTGFQPGEDLDNIRADYQSIMPWVYDDQPYLDSNYFPRMSVLEVNNTNKGSLGIYFNYPAYPGEYITKRVKIQVRARRNEPAQGIVYNGLHLKNYDLVAEISENVERYINFNRVPTPWKFVDWHIVNSERIFSEEDVGIIRRDITLDVLYSRSPSAPVI